MINSKILKDASQIWVYLDLQGEASIEEVSKKFSLADDEITAAIEYLTNLGEISKMEIEGRQIISLK